MGFNRITPANQVESWQLAVPARLHPPLRDEDPRHLCVRYWMRLPKTFDKLEDHKLIFIDGHGSKPTPISLHLIVAVFASKVKVSKSQMANVCSRSAVVGDSDHWKWMQNRIPKFHQMQDTVNLQSLECEQLLSNQTVEWANAASMLQVEWD